MFEWNDFKVLDEGCSLFKFLIGCGCIGCCFVLWFWEFEFSFDCDSELLIVVCKKWYVVKCLIVVIWIYI